MTKTTQNKPKNEVVFNCDATALQCDDMCTRGSSAQAWLCRSNVGAGQRGTGEEGQSCFGTVLSNWAKCECTLNVFQVPLSLITLYCLYLTVFLVTYTLIVMVCNILAQAKVPHGEKKVEDIQIISDIGKMRCLHRAQRYQKTTPTLATACSPWCCLPLSSSLHHKIMKNPTLA